MAPLDPRRSRDLLRLLQTAVASHYTVHHEIGRGGTAAVFLADDLANHRPVAIKVLHPQLTIALGPGRFLKEIRILRRLEHPGILPVLDAGGSAVDRLDGSAVRRFIGSEDPEDEPADPETTELLWFVMPYVEGETLRAHIDRVGPLPIDRMLAIAGEIAAALDYAHGQEVIHRDIKPDNVLLAAERAVVCDFGVARAIMAAGDESFSSSGLVVGTPAYMSPEQATGGQVDWRTDIYALGCVVYEMLSGELPFTGPNSQAILARQLHDRPRSLRTVRPEVSPATEKALIRALERNPGARPASAGEFLAALSQA
jgi:serine/threonine protein kinase